MDFSYTPLKIRSESLMMDYFVVPWDTDILDRPVAEICLFKILDAKGVNSSYTIFENWCETQSIQLCSCRINHSDLAESFFLQNHDFRFIELNYRPEIHGLQNHQFLDDSIKVEKACSKDQELLTQMAGEIFKHGRFHQDPGLGAKIGNDRYKIWLLNSFSSTCQSVYKCLMDGEIVGFFVVEYLQEKSCNWTLIGLAPGLDGHGLGTRVWKAMMRYHQREGLDSIVTSISSHNIAVFNLFIKLGFRFPLPQTTFHWRP